MEQIEEIFNINTLGPFRTVIGNIGSKGVAQFNEITEKFQQEFLSSDS